ncbi:hypothetical protein CIHG_07555 [Coccidioides immitis H538.4]|uniref:Uncharacterized protein n=3 Tax=Coccidioides immitis TaxID=5501 RepID=A0A0J8R565_COCIT|nr:hypothetical protein CIRG_07846 [Coccidioides immitis RMSCC 2394]KMU79555.1 hypothetical protein CISG_01973 [Coccidioides immitis RMSCC 3703]KMU89872.1 hypothetical protein CIHG_07555 [Coccidioides immitis H538.4]
MAVAPCTVASPEVACRFPSVKVTENSKLFLAAIGLRLKLPAEPYPLEIRRGRESTAPRRISGGYRIISSPSVRGPILLYGRYWHTALFLLSISIRLQPSDSSNRLVFQLH